MNGSIGSPAEQTRRSSEQRLLAILQNLVNELRDGGGGVRMDSHLDRDLGLDSLARVELLLRLEREFGASLPAGVLVEAEPPHALLLAFGAAARGRPPRARRGSRTSRRLDAADRSRISRRVFRRAVGWGGTRAFVSARAAFGDGGTRAASGRHSQQLRGARVHHLARGADTLAAVEGPRARAADSGDRGGVDDGRATGGTSRPRRR